MNLRHIDLNQLVILKHLLEERHVTNTALQLSISQPTVSRSLNRLRKLFNDPLLVKTTLGFELTSKAESIKLELNAVLANLENLLDKQEFNPATCNKTVRLVGLSPQMESIAPALLKHLRTHAPNIVVEIDTIPQPPFTALHAGNCHFSITSHDPLVNDQNLHGITLTRSDFRLVMSSSHPLAEQTLELESLRSCQFGQISLQGEKVLSIEAGFHTQDDPSFHISTPIRLSNFSCAAGIAEATDIIFHLPTHYAQAICEHRNLVMREVPAPLSLETKEFKLYWHKRFHDDPLCIWMRSVIKELTNTID